MTAVRNKARRTVYFYPTKFLTSLVYAMTDTLINAPLGEESALVQTCRTQHQTWAATIAQHEQEIDQLLALLNDLLEHHNYQSLRHRAVNYYGDLNHLKSGFQRLRLDTICQTMDCSHTQRQSCREPRFSLYATIESRFHALTDDLNRIQAGCYQFLSVMVTLNLL